MTKLWFKLNENASTYFSGHHRDVVPFGHFSVQRLQRCDGAIERVNVEQPLEICVPINGVSEVITCKS